MIAERGLTNELHHRMECVRPTRIAGGVAPLVAQDLSRRVQVVQNGQRLVLRKHW
jgi:hypothetical protein